jgi:hypothetical protein
MPQGPAEEPTHALRQHPIPDPKEAAAACDTKRHRLVPKRIAGHIHNQAAIPQVSGNFQFFIR